LIICQGWAAVTSYPLLAVSWLIKWQTSNRNTRHWSHGFSV